MKLALSWKISGFMVLCNSQSTVKRLKQRFIVQQRKGCFFTVSKSPEIGNSLRSFFGWHLKRHCCCFHMNLVPNSVTLRTCRCNKNTHRVFTIRDISNNCSSDLEIVLLKWIYNDGLVSDKEPCHGWHQTGSQTLSSHHQCWLIKIKVFIDTRI